MKSFYLTCLLLIPMLAQAQQDRFKWRIGFQSGIMSYYGDLNSRFLPASQPLLDQEFSFLTHSISLEKNLSASSAIRLSASRGQFLANDRAINFSRDLLTSNTNFRRSLNVMTEIEAISLQYLYYFDNDRILSRTAWLAPYLGIGGGWTSFQPFADLLDATGNRYYYWQDLTIRDAPDGTIGATIIEQDGVYETSLASLETEGVDYNTSTWHIAGIFGLKFRVASRLNLNLEYQVRYTGSDFLDDVGGDFRGQYKYSDICVLRLQC